MTNKTITPYKIVRRELAKWGILRDKCSECCGKGSHGSNDELLITTACLGCGGVGWYTSYTVDVTRLMREAAKVGIDVGVEHITLIPPVGRAHFYADAYLIDDNDTSYDYLHPTDPGEAACRATLEALEAKKKKGGTGYLRPM